jgi:phage gp16-like protein
MGATVRENGRRADLAAIHVAKKALGWDDDTYRDVMFAVVGVRSSAELDFTGRRRFLAHLADCQRREQQAAGGPKLHPAVKTELSPKQRLMWSLWMRLADAGLVEHRTMTALMAFAKRQTGVDRLQWLQPAQTDLVIESLKKWLRSRGEAV